MYKIFARLASTAQHAFACLQGCKDKKHDLSKLLHDVGQVKKLEVSLLKPNTSNDLVAAVAHRSGDGQLWRRKMLASPFWQLQDLVRVLHKQGHQKAGDRVQAAADERAEHAAAEKLEFKVETATSETLYVQVAELVRLLLSPNIAMPCGPSGRCK